MNKKLIRVIGIALAALMILTAVAGPLAALL